MKKLKSRLYEYEMAKKQVALDGVEKSEIGWDIRYVLTLCSLTNK